VVGYVLYGLLSAYGGYARSIRHRCGVTMTPGRRLGWFPDQAMEFRVRWLDVREVQDTRARPNRMEVRADTMNEARKAAKAAKAEARMAARQTKDAATVWAAGVAVSTWSLQRNIIHVVRCPAGTKTSGGMGGMMFQLGSAPWGARTLCPDPAGMLAAERGRQVAKILPGVSPDAATCAVCQSRWAAIRAEQLSLTESAAGITPQQMAVADLAAKIMRIPDPNQRAQFRALRGSEIESMLKTAGGGWHWDASNFLVSDYENSMDLLRARMGPS
jgi:hypothetical protein